MKFFESILQGKFIDPSTVLGALFYAFVFLMIATLAARALRLTVLKVLERDTGRRIDRNVALFMTQLAQIVIYLLALSFYAHLIPELRALGTALLAGVSVVSVVIGLAAQNTLGNLIAGISLVLYRPFDEGDRLQITAPNGLETGIVESLTLGYTVLKTFDNRRVVVPNSAMASQVTINLTTKDPRVIAVVPIGISYDSDIDKAREMLITLARDHPGVDEIVNCPVTELGNSSVVLTLRVWCADSVAALHLQYDIFEQAKKRFDQEGIEIPFPYTNVVLKQQS